MLSRKSNVAVRRGRGKRRKGIVKRLMLQKVRQFCTSIVKTNILVNFFVDFLMVNFFDIIIITTLSLTLSLLLLEPKDLTISELKEGLRRYGRRLSGNKGELVARLEVAITESDQVENNRAGVAGLVVRSDKVADVAAAATTTTTATAETENDLFNIEYDGVERPIRDEEQVEKVGNDGQVEEMIVGGEEKVRDERETGGEDEDNRRYKILYFVQYMYQSNCLYHICVHVYGCICLHV
jgi:hypothetical protein